MNACGFFAQSGITTLIGKCLLQGTNNYYMHDLVRDMGREIVRQESLMLPEKRSRLFSCDEVLDVLVNNKGNEAIETMIIDLPKEVHLTTEVFSKMSRLRLLTILSMNAKGSRPLKYLSKELKVLFWNYCPLRHISFDLCLKKLVILNITHSNIEEFKPNFQHFKCLQSLCLDHCKQLKRVSNFTGAHSLKTLSLFSCSNLVELPQSIGDLISLVELELGLCKNLKELPASICKLKSLKCLFVNGCSKLKELPNNLEKLEELRELHAAHTSVSLSHVHFSCGSFRYLNHLELPKLLLCSMSVEPVGCLTSSIANLCSAGCLSGPYHYVQHLDIQIGHGSLSLLTYLDLSNSYFDTLPFNLCHLFQLKFLTLNNCQNLQIVQDLPPSLCYFSAKNCPLLQDVQDLSGIFGLWRLYLSNCSNLIELRGIENLVDLREIDIINCSALSSSKSWFVNLFKALLHNPNHQQFTMSVSKEMVSKYLCSNNEVAGCSSNYSLPLFLKKKGIFIVVEILCLFRQQFLDYKMIGTELIYPDDDMEVRCTVYNLFTEPNKFEEVEELIELHSSPEQRWKERSILQTCVVYEEEGEVYFIPMNPNVVITFHPESTDDEITGMEREQQNEGSCIWDVVCLHPLFRCLGFSD